MAPCEWPVDRTCLPVFESEVDLARLKAAEDLAVAVLWNLSGRQFGACPTLARPCPAACGETFASSLWPYGPGWLPVYTDGSWRNTTCGCTGRGCSLSGPSSVHLPGPAVEVVEVRVGDTVLDPASTVLEGDRLLRAGGAAWPAQNLSRPLPEPGTWSVLYLRGTPVPEGVGTLVGVLAKEFLAACDGGKCRLPRNVSQVTRRGVTYTMYDAGEIYRKGLTGLGEVDLWLSSVNPHQLSEAPSVR